MRSRTDAMLRQLTSEMDREIARIAQARGVEVKVEPMLETKAAPCAPWVIGQLDDAVRKCGITPIHLPSGAGHDGMAMIALGPIGMLFVRCKAGISHSPRESVEAADVTVAARILREFIDNFVQEKS
jgi:allantoate deiminase